MAEDSQLAELAERARKQLRARLRATRQALPPAAAAARSARLVELLSGLEVLRRARSVALFWPIEEQREVDLRAFDRELMQRGTQRYYPYMDALPGGGFRTGFRRIERTEQLQRRGRTFAEPPPDAVEAKRGDVDVVLVPAVAASPDGHRLGYGTGFYDATLPDVCPPALSVIVVYSFQLVVELPHAAHDVCCDLVVSDQEIFDPRGVLTPPQA